MIRYKLICKSCDTSFDSWFASSSEFDKLKKRNFLTCHNCNSKDIEKNLMAPKIMSQSSTNYLNKDIKKYNDIKDKLRQYQNFVKDNFEYVGENFAYEARSLHYKTKKKNKGIYGKATSKEIKELKEEGIETEMIPWVDVKNN